MQLYELCRTKLSARQLSQRKCSLCAQGNATPASFWNAILLLIRLL